MGSNPLQTTKKIEKRLGRLKNLSYLCQTKNKSGACFNSDILRSVRLAVHFGDRTASLSGSKRGFESRTDYNEKVDLAKNQHRSVRLADVY